MVTTVFLLRNTTRAKKPVLNASVVVAILLAASSTATADEPFVDAVLDCRPLESAEQRLQCYDDIVDGYAPGGAVAAGAMATAGAGSVEGEDPEYAFGLPPEQDDSEELRQIEATIVKITPISAGWVSIVLDNGHQWRQTNNSTIPLSVGDEVLIRRGIMGSHTLTKEGNSRTMKVKRVQ